MTLELMNTLAAIGTFAVITATAIAAAVQLRHLRRNNQLQAVLALRTERATKVLDEAFDFVSTQLHVRLEDAAFRAELESPRAPSRQRHKELNVADYFEHVGTYIKKGLIDEDVYFELGNPERYWVLLAPAIAIYRRRRGLSVYENFEYLVLRAREWDKAHPDGTFPRGIQRLELEDSYAGAEQLTMP
jgi:hypothetical protein